MVVKANTPPSHWTFIQRLGLVAGLTLLLLNVGFLLRPGAVGDAWKVLGKIKAHRMFARVSVFVNQSSNPLHWSGKVLFSVSNSSLSGQEVDSSLHSRPRINVSLLLENTTQEKLITDVFGVPGHTFTWPTTVRLSCVRPGYVSVCTKPRKKFIVFRHAANKDFIHGQPSDGLSQFGCCGDVMMAYTTNESFRSIADIVEVDALDGRGMSPQSVPQPSFPSQLMMVVSGEAQCCSVGDHVMRRMNLLRSFHFTSDVIQNMAQPGECFCKKYLEPLKVPFEKRNTAPMSALISNCGSYAQREKVLAFMTSNMEVHSFGNCWHNQEIPSGMPIEDTLGTYLFNLAAENSICEDYITEKLSRAFAVGTVPVVLSHGNLPGYEKVSPNNNSYVELSKFPKLQDAVDFIKSISKSKDDYMKHHTYRGQPATSDVLSDSFKKNVCERTERAHLEEWCKLVRRMEDTVERAKMATKFLTNYSGIAAKQCAAKGIMATYVTR